MLVHYLKQYIQEMPSKFQLNILNAFLVVAIYYIGSNLVKTSN